MNKRKNETEIHLYKYLTEKKQFNNKWDTKKIPENKYIQSILDTSSKRETGNHGEPDLIYLNNDKKLLILLENKDSINDHISNDKKVDPVKYSVDGVKHYLSFFLPKNLSKENKHLKDWRIIGIAFSGSIEDNYNSVLDTFYIKENKIENADTKEFLDEDEYIAIFENIDIEKITNEISKSSQKINNQLRNIDSHNRPVLLSALMISLLDKHDNDFRENYPNFTADTITTMIPNTVKKILVSESINIEKINILINKLSFLKDDLDLQNNDNNLLKEILDELKNKVIPLFKRKSNYDIIGKFYEEFLKYAGIANVKKGIVLTPHHITTLFADLIDMKTNDVIFDPCCGTGAFLIAGMNKMHKIIDNSTIANKTELKDKIKEKQLVGFEKNSTMFALAISNMLFRGDGKSKIYNYDFFSKEAFQIIDEMKPSIGFINPPYSGADNDKNPTKKEIQFLERMLDNVSRYGIIIAPISTYFKDSIIRNRILGKHTLKYVINMPNELFEPNATTHTAIAVFETHNPHNNKEVIFYDLKDDGFVLSKNKGRTDRLNKWKSIKHNLLFKLKNVDTKKDNLTLLKKEIGNNEEWIIQAHSDTDYSMLSNIDFENSIKEYTIFNVKQSLKILEKKLSEVELFNLITNGSIDPKKINNKFFDLNKNKWKTFSVKKLLKPSLGKPIHKVNIDGKINPGSTPYVTRTKLNNGIELFLDSNGLETKKSEGICITIGAEGLKPFYQRIDFLTGNKVNILRNKNINIYSALFINTILNLIINEKFTYGRAVVKNRLEKLYVKLPVDKDGNPDWKFMEDYIKSLPYSGNL